MYKVLFIALHRPGRSPSQRFRYEQYVNFLEQNNFDCSWSYLLNEKEDTIFYSPGNSLKKLMILIKAFFIRIKDIFRANQYDILFIQREAYMIGPAFFERLLKLGNHKIIYDFDDAIWINDTSEENKKFSWLKSPGKVKDIIALSDSVFVGNNYLYNYANNYNNNVKIIPTTIDTDRIKPFSMTDNNTRVCVGWSGSPTTIKHFKTVIPVLKRIKKIFGNKVYFKLIGDEKYEDKILEIKGVKWTKEDEIKSISEIDIGIMPLPDNEWTKGKCGFKSLLYMAMEIPAVISPVGINTEIIQDGINGFIAHHEEEWIQKLSLLIEDKELRKRIGKAGRKTVIEKYSVESQKKYYLQYLNELLSGDFNQIEKNENS